MAEALRHEKGSPERAAAVAALAARPDLTDWRGRPITLSERTIQRKIKALEDGGLAALGRKRRADAGAKKAVITRAWDGAVPFDDAEKLRIRERLDRHIRNLWGNGAPLNVARRLASEHLAELTRDAGFDPGPDQLAALCALNDHVIGRHRRARKVHEFNTDRKRFEDSKRRVRQHLDDMGPLQGLMGDVHPIDVNVLREDGSVATPRAIAWLDVGTGRIRWTLILLEKGQGIRNEDVARSFLEVIQDPEWGVPQHLYLDNGSEYNWADFIEGAMKLVNGPVLPFDRRSPVIRAKPYNAPAKKIESYFRLIERLLSAMPGYIGGNRLLKKSANVGRPPEPFPGTWTDFLEQVDGILRFYNTNPQRGQLRGRSPLQIFRLAQEAGWQSMTADPMALLLAFTVREPKIVSQGCVSVRGRRFTVDGLSLFNGERVEVAVPRYGGFEAVGVFTPDGKVLVAREDQPFAYLDPAGAAEAARRDKVDRKLIADLRKTVEPIDVVDLMAQSGQRAEGISIPPRTQVRALTDRTKRLAHQLQETPEEAAKRKRRENNEEVARKLAAIDMRNRGVA